MTAAPENGTDRKNRRSMRGSWRRPSQTMRPIRASEASVQLRRVVAPQAESLIGEGVIALEMGATLEDIGLSIHPHPTLTESIGDAAEAAHGKAIHIVNPKPKTPVAVG